MGKHLIRSGYRTRDLMNSSRLRCHCASEAVKIHAIYNQNFKPSYDSVNIIKFVLQFNCFRTLTFPNSGNNSSILVKTVTPNEKYDTNEKKRYPVQPTSGTKRFTIRTFQSRIKIQTTLRTLHIRKLSTNDGVHNNVPSEELRTIE